MPDVLHFQVALEPHHRHSGKKTGRKICFLAEVPLNVAKATAKSPDDEQSIRQEAERLAAELTSMAMTGRVHQPGEDAMQVSFHSIPTMARDLTDRKPDAEKDRVRLWLLGADIE